MKGNECAVCGGKETEENDRLNCAANTGAGQDCSGLRGIPPGIKCVETGKVYTEHGSTRLVRLSEQIEKYPSRKA